MFVWRGRRIDERWWTKENEIEDEDDDDDGDEDEDEMKKEKYNNFEDSTYA